MLRILASTLLPAAASSSTELAWSVYWYWALPGRPPIRRSWTGWKEGGRAGSGGGGAARPRQDLVRGQAALVRRGEGGVDAAGIDGVPPAAPAAAGEPEDALHVRIARDRLDHLRQLVRHRLERDVLRRLDAAGDPPGVLLREEALRHQDEELHAERDGAERDDQHEERMTEHP